MAAGFDPGPHYPTAADGSFEGRCRRCSRRIPPLENATACDTCTYSVCTDCVPLGSEIRCPDCTIYRVRVTTAAVPPEPAPKGRIPLPPLGCVIPPPLTVVLARVGRVRLVPTAPVSASAWQIASPLRRARLSIVATVPLGSAALRCRAWETLLAFCALFALCLQALTAEDIADFVVWRSVTEIPEVPAPPRGVPILASSAMGDLAALRAHALATGSLREDVLYGHCITVVLKRLSSGEKHDSVRKTPVPADEIVRLVDVLENPAISIARRTMAYCLILAWFLFMRVGELLALSWTQVVFNAQNPGVTVTFLRTKVSQGLAPIPVSRTCIAPLLIRATRSFLRALTRQALPTAGNLLPPDTNVQEVMRSFFGLPPIRPGETRALPWSLRAGAATACYMAGMAPDRIMRLGRWASQVALMYAVLTPAVQARIYDALGAEDWWLG